MTDRNVLILIMIFMLAVSTYLTGYKNGSEESTAIWEATFSDVVCYPEGE